MKDNPVITAKQAKEITGGRTPLVPVEYETAIEALAACVSIDEAKYWDNKADALAAWAKIYRSDEADRKAKQLKLHAYRRMGELARELRPMGFKRVRDRTYKNGFRAVRTPGPRSLLRESGLTETEANAAVTLANLTPDRFSELESKPRPQSPITAVRLERTTTSRVCAWISALASATRNLTPGEFKNNLPHQAKAWRDNAEEIHEWLGLVLRKGPPDE